MLHVFKLLLALIALVISSSVLACESYTDSKSKVLQISKLVIEPHSDTQKLKKLSSHHFQQETEREELHQCRCCDLGCNGSCADCITCVVAYPAMDNLPDKALGIVNLRVNVYQKCDVTPPFFSIEHPPQ
ncbi:hypothetical protein Kkor_1286 [Kangiella koreensis DSM 16069]|uniref:Uncharacterized protein n=1 Tax=Kangiella koreensis (strain DSM 16069 / JCM 12317 / KCTC 12182 / SW-125) TaxID=523791 RepID=C7RBR0_KANKD|nr:hypothetical protein Kkor_1286 [Kangiella koreensis DSM 16069]